MLRSSGRGISGLCFGPGVDEEPDALCAGAAAWLEAWFAGRFLPWELPLDAPGTPFQQEVWAQLMRIPVGQTRSYGELAKGLGRPGGARAVGLANHDNPIAIIVPCHRVVGSKGELVGYAGGLERKRWLLLHEGAAVVAQRSLF
jgi:methylated-DNA-[protein]-cysteine S-methyltransferase